MENSDFFDADVPVMNQASGYITQGGSTTGQAVRRNNIYTRPKRGSSAGGGYSTAPDLLRFANALKAGKLVVPRYDPAGAQRPGAGGRGNAGLGIAGGAPGINATLDTDIAGHYTVIVMANYDPPAAVNVARQIRQWLAGASN